MKWGRLKSSFLDIGDYMKDLANLLFPNLKVTREELEKKYPRRNLENGQMVTRFAPSPTGFVHLGSLYTSFICSTFAKQTTGVFYLRIEDTDQVRKVDNGIEGIINDLKTFQIEFDEGESIGGIYAPYTQSQRKEIYQAFIKSLIEEGKAYPCFLTQEEINEIRANQETNKERLGIYGKYAKYRNYSLDDIKKMIDDNIPYVIRFKSEGDFNKTIEVKDCIKGKIKFPENDMDVIIMKSDGLPTYHFAHVVDDYLMHTTHVIRGDEWLSSLPIHIQLFQSLHIKAPKYAHISPLTKKDGATVRKLSKRYDSECALVYYDQSGIPKDALKIYFATLMNPNFEPFYMSSKQSKIEDYKFEFSKMPVGGTLFDLNKLLSISKIYLSRLSNVQIYNEMLTYYQKYDKSFYDILVNNEDISLAALNIERTGKRPRKDFSIYSDMKKELWYFYDELFDLHSVYENVEIKNTYINQFLQDYFNNYYSSCDNHAEWYEKVKLCAQKYGYAAEVKEYKENPSKYIGHIGDACECIRVAVTTSLKTPDLYEVLKVLGKERILTRVNIFLKKIS